MNKRKCLLVQINNAGCAGTCITKTWMRAASPGGTVMNTPSTVDGLLRERARALNDGALPGGLPGAPESVTCVPGAVAVAVAVVGAVVVEVPAAVPKEFPQDPAVPEEFLQDPVAVVVPKEFLQDPVAVAVPAGVS